MEETMKKVVIVGGGFAGAYCARTLEKEFEVTLIDQKEYYEFTPSILRTLVEPEHARKIQALHSSYLTTTEIIKEKVIDITPKGVKTTKTFLPFDYAIICSGSRYNDPIKGRNVVIASRAAELQQYTEKLRQAERVLIVGGGLVGVELAAEIVTAFPNKKVTLVHAMAELMERNHPNARRYAQAFLQKKGVDIIFNEFVTKHTETECTTDQGRKIKADLVFLCIGIIPNYGHLSGMKESLNERHYLKVNENLQVMGYENIFAAGDITAIMEEKTAQNAEKQAEVVAENIKRLERGKQLQRYASRPRTIVISLGKWDGILVRRNIVLTGLIPGMLKTLIEWKTMRKY